MKKIFVLLLCLALCTLCVTSAFASTAYAGDTAGNYYGTSDSVTEEDVRPTEDFLLRIGVSFLIALVISLIIVFLMKRALNTVRREKAADRYTKEGSFALTESRDIFLYSTVTRVRINTNNKKH